MGTQVDGSFVLADVPAPIEWYVYPKMESVPKGRAATPVQCATKQGGEVVEIGIVSLDAGHQLKGKVALNNGAAMSDGMRLIIASNEVWDSQVVPIQPDGSFQIDRLPTSNYGISPALRGFRSAEPVNNVFIDRDISDFKLVLRPEPNFQ